mmetsp:Transcript_121658/g.210413  ORF Transcript_121658/g.210413 Transcript_121658/m.210413 type:complete len:101 (+) Transcript_121658:36-338(+)
MLMICAPQRSSVSKELAGGRFLLKRLHVSWSRFSRIGCQDTTHIQGPNHHHHKDKVQADLSFCEFRSRRPLMIDAFPQWRCILLLMVLLTFILFRMMASE